MKAATLSDEEIHIRAQLDDLRHVVGDQIVYGPDPQRGTALMFDLYNCYRGMVWRSIDQRQSRKSLSKGHYGLDENGDPDKPMQELLKVRADTLKKREQRAKDKELKSRLKLARSLQLRIDKRSEKILAGIDRLCIVLHRPPTKFELRKHLKMSGPAFSEVTHFMGLNWLPEQRRGR